MCKYWGFLRLGLLWMTKVKPFHFIFSSQVTIYVSCSRECCNVVLLWSSRNVWWTKKPWIAFLSARGWTGCHQDDDWLVILSFKAERQVVHTVDSTLAPEEKEVHMAVVGFFSNDHWQNEVAHNNQWDLKRTQHTVWLFSLYGICLVFCLHPEVKCCVCNLLGKPKASYVLVHATVTVTQVTPTGAGTFNKTRENADTVQDDNFICLDICFPENVSVNHHVSHLLETM